MNSAAIDRYTERLANHYGQISLCSIPFDDISIRNIDEIFRLIKQIKPVQDEFGYARSLWLSADRDSPEDYDELSGAAEFSSGYGELRAENRPDETVWYKLFIIVQEDIGYKAVFLNRRLIIEIDPRKRDYSYKEDISGLTAWLLEQVQNCIGELRAGTYNERINSSLPFCHRVGTILRKDLWDIFPQRRVDFFKNITQAEISEFVSLIKDQYSHKPKRLAHLTANDFFEMCAAGYKANQYPDTQLSAKEQYYRHADGRDDGLGKIDAYSEKEFIHWLYHRVAVGHPWDICAGGVILLYVDHNRNGFRITLACRALTKTTETVKFYLALRKAGYPVNLRDGGALARRLLGTERIGIVPDGVTPCCCESLFPDEHITDFMNLPTENRQLTAAHTQWQEIKPVELAEK